MRTTNSQKGFSLIELMIAIVLSMVLMGAILQFVLSNKKTYEISDEVSRIQENGRISLDILVKDVQLAGYQQSRDIQPDMIYKDTSCYNGGNPLPPCGADGGGTNSDTLSVQYAPPDTVTRDCTGTSIPASAKLIVNMYYVQDPENDGVSTLYCRGYDVTNAAYISNAAPLIDGVDNMQILYQILDPDTKLRSYVSLDRLTTDDYANISAARIALLVSNGLESGTADAKTRQFQVLDSGTITFINDRHPRRIYSTTVQFNNRFLGAN